MSLPSRDAHKISEATIIVLLFYIVTDDREKHREEFRRMR